MPFIISLILPSCLVLPKVLLGSFRVPQIALIAVGGGGDARGSGCRHGRNLIKRFGSTSHLTGGKLLNVGPTAQHNPRAVVGGGGVEEIK